MLYRLDSSSNYIMGDILLLVSSLHFSSSNSQTLEQAAINVTETTFVTITTAAHYVELF